MNMQNSANLVIPEQKHIDACDALIDLLLDDAWRAWTATGHASSRPEIQREIDMLNALRGRVESAIDARA